MPEMKTLTIGSDKFTVVDGESVHFTKHTLTEEQKAQARANIGVAEAIEEYVVDHPKLANTGFMTIAHRGYSVESFENTAQAIIDAASVGFEWVEIDIRKCADGTYVLSHDADVTLYSDGTPASVTIETSKYSDIKGYTWDADGKYHLCTLRAAFATMRQHGVKAVCDRCSGTNTDILSIAATSGMLDSVMLSYLNHYLALDDAELLGKYKRIPIRIIPNDLDGVRSVMTTLSNPIYADVYSNIYAFEPENLSRALACNMPIIFSGCTDANTEVWAGVASGAMTEAGWNFIPADFHNHISAVYDAMCNISVTQDITLEVDGSVEVVATSDVESVAGYIYAFSATPDIVSVAQTQFGRSAKITITGINGGTGIVRLFTPSGTMVDISVTVGGGGNTIVEFAIIKGSFDSGVFKYLPPSTAATRACMNPCMVPVNIGDIVRMTIPDGYYASIALLTVPDPNADYTVVEGTLKTFDATTRTHDSGYQTGVYEEEVTAGNMFGINIKRSDNGTITDEDISNLQAGLSIEIL